MAKGSGKLFVRFKLNCHMYGLSHSKGSKLNTKNSKLDTWAHCVMCYIDSACRKESVLEQKSIKRNRNY